MSVLSGFQDYQLASLFKLSKLEHLKTSDCRLSVRCKKILETIRKNPNRSFPQVIQNRNQLKLLYRFFSNDNINHQEILEATYQDTLSKLDLLDSDEMILVAQDTSEFDFTNRPNTNLGYLHKKKHNGFLSHSGLAITSSGLPVGLLFQKNWIRNRDEFGKKHDRARKPLKEKESYRWLECLEHLDKLNNTLIKNSHKPKHFLVVGDRESDILEVLKYQSETNIDILVRCRHDRLLDSSKKYKNKHIGKLFELLKDQEVKGTLELEIGHSGQLPERNIILNLKWSSIFIDKQIFWVVEASNKDKDVSWRLITTIQITNQEEAKQIVYFYHLRWLIERFHYVLKSGCQIEDLQLEEEQSLFKALTIYNIIASDILLVTYFARLLPDLSCLIFFTELEWKTIYTYVNHHRPKHNKPTPNIQEVTKWLGVMGGYIPNKKHPPGVKAIWTGLTVLKELVRYELILQKGR